MNSFSPIGSFSIKVEDRVMNIEQTGPFNLAYALEYVAESSRVTTALNAEGPYAVCVSYSNSVLYAPDALRFVYDRARLVEGTKQNCVGIAILVTPEVAGMSKMQAAFERFFHLRGLTPETGRLFSDANEAHQWLRERFVLHSAVKLPFETDRLARLRRVAARLQF